MLRTVTIVLIMLIARSAFASYDDGARYAFVESAGEKSIYVIDLQEKVLADTISVQYLPSSVAASDQLKAVIVAHEADKQLTLIDLTSDTLTQIEYPLDLHPTYVAVSPLGEMVIVYDAEAARVEVHSLKRREIVLSAEDVHTTTEFTFGADGSRLYWTDNVAGTFNSIDLWSRRASIEIAEANAGLSAMSRSVDGALGFLSIKSRNTVHIIDLTAFTSLLELTVGSMPGRPWGTADGRFMLIPNLGDGTISAISNLDGVVEYTVPVVGQPVSINPGWLDTTAAVISKSGQVAFLDIETGNVTKRFELKGAPKSAVVTSDSRTLAIPTNQEGHGQITFFDMRERSVGSIIDGLGRDLGDASLAVSNNLCH